MNSFERFECSTLEWEHIFSIALCSFWEHHHWWIAWVFFSRFLSIDDLLHCHVTIRPVDIEALLSFQDASKYRYFSTICFDTEARVVDSTRNYGIWPSCVRSNDDRGYSFWELLLCLVIRSEPLGVVIV